MHGNVRMKGSTRGETLLKQTQIICPMALNLFYIHPYIELFVGNAKTTKFLFALFLKDKVILWSETPKTIRHAHCRSEEGLFT